MLPQLNQPPSKEEFEEWLTNPVSQAFFKQFLPLSVEGFKSQWLAGRFIMDDDLETTAVANMQALAQAQVYQDLGELDYQKFIEVIGNDDK